MSDRRQVALDRIENARAARCAKLLATRDPGAKDLGLSIEIRAAHYDQRRLDQANGIDTDAIDTIELCISEGMEIPPELWAGMDEQTSEACRKRGLPAPITGGN